MSSLILLFSHDELKLACESCVNFYGYEDSNKHNYPPSDSTPVGKEGYCATGIEYMECEQSHTYAFENANADRQCRCMTLVMQMREILAKGDALYWKSTESV